MENMPLHREHTKYDIIEMNTEQTIKLGEEMQIENNEIIFVLLQLHISY